MNEAVTKNFKVLQQKWLASIDMLTELNRKGFSVPQASELLRHVKSMISEAMLNRSADQNFFIQADQYMDEAQREIFMAAEPLGQEYIEKWDEVFRKIIRGEKYGDFRFNSSQFYPRLPRDDYWVRLRVSDDASPGDLKRISDRNGVEIKEHQENHLVVTGEKARVKKALQELSAYLG